MSPLVVRDEIFGQHRFAAEVARPPHGHVVVQLCVLLQPRGRLEPASANLALKELCDEAVRVGDMPVRVVFPLEGRRAIGAEELPLAHVSGGHVLPEQRCKDKVLGTNVARMRRPRTAITVGCESVVAEAALREDPGAPRTVGTGVSRPLVGAFNVLLQVRGRFENFGALRAGVRPGLAVAVIQVLRQLGPRGVGLVAEVAGEEVRVRGGRGGRRGGEDLVPFDA